MTGFFSTEFLPASVIAHITAMRVDEPSYAVQAAAKRLRRNRLTEDGRLSILAADHPGRGVTQVGSDPFAMANRHDFLARVVRVLTGSDIDGVMATMDVLEDLLVLDRLIQDRGGPSFLDRKLLLPSLNRGGLARSAWELDDPMTGPSPEACAHWHMDGGKLLLRVCEADAGSLRTLRACADVITRMNAVELPTFLEPLPVIRTDSGLEVVKEARALARLIGVASALGDSSHRLWLKLPYCDDYEIVARATTLPILLLGGQAVGDARPMLRQVSAGMAAGANVRGALVGRNVLYPGDADPRSIAVAVHGVVHHQWDMDRALDQSWAMAKSEGADREHISRWFRDDDL